MSPSTYRVRRATLDDLNILRAMWESMNIPAVDLDKRLTEFQVVQALDGTVVGALGFEMCERQGLLHSEAFSDLSVAEIGRALLWDRIRTLASNHGIFRLWTREQAPFWRQHGLVPARPDVLEKLPAQWQTTDSQWFTVALKDEQAIVSMEKELAMLMAAEKARTARTLQRAQIVKYVATGLAVILAIFVAIAVFYLIRNNPGGLRLGR
jgi:hypothetical protein